MKRIFPLLVTIICLSCDPEAAIETPQATSTNWWKHRVFYEIFVRSFYDSNGDGIGDLKGVIQKLDYLNDGDPNTDTDLGITGIWLMPVHPSGSSAGYDVVDYLRINDEYGTMADFRELIAKAHDRGIKVIIDFMANQTSDRHPWFAPSLNTRSDKHQYYIWSNAPAPNVWLFGGSNSYYYATFSSTMPDLNLRSDKVTSEMINVARFWDETAGVDGYRMDAIPYLLEESASQKIHTDGTMHWLRNFWLAQKQRNPSLMLVGDVSFSTAEVVPYTDQRTDYCFEYDLADAILGAIAGGDVSSLKMKVNEVIAVYPERQYGVFLTNHGQNRVMERMSLDINKAKLAATIMLTLPGVPYIYYGEEVGMRGLMPEEDIRRPMQWSTQPNGGFSHATPWHQPNDDYMVANVAELQKNANSIWHHYRKLIQIRTHNLAMTQGFYFPIESTSAQIFSYMLVNGNDGVLVVHNLSAGALTTSLSASTSRLEAGTYQAIDMLDGTALGNVVIGTGGKLENVNLGGVPIDGLSSRIIHLVGI
jgi:alpha-amylase